MQAFDIGTGYDVNEYTRRYGVPMYGSAAFQRQPLPAWAQRGLSSDPNAALLDPDENYLQVLEEYKSSVPDTTELQGKYSNRMMQALESPGLSEAEVERIINKGSDELAESERSAGLALKQAAGASGFGADSGDFQGGLRDVASNFAGQRAGLARNTRIDAANSRENMRMQGLNAAGNYLGQVQQQRNRMLDFKAKGAPGMASGGSGGGASKGTGWSIGGGSMTAATQSRADAAQNRWKNNLF